MIDTEKSKKQNGENCKDRKINERKNEEQYKWKKGNGCRKVLIYWIRSHSGGMYVMYCKDGA